jgi:hypothetical protein
MGTKEDQIMDAKTEKAAKDVKKRETEENKGFREKLIEKITPSFLKKQKEKKKAMDNIEKGMKKGGAVKKGYHKMPDGTVMKDSAHKMKHGGMVGKCKRDGIAVRGKTKAGR